MSSRFFIRTFLAEIAVVFVALSFAAPARAQDANGGGEKRLIEIKNADRLIYRRETKITELTGRVEIVQGDITLRADAAEIDEKTKTVSARGNINFIDPKNQITGDYIFFNYDIEYFEILNPRGSVTSPKVQGRVFYRGNIAKGNKRKVKIYNGVMTTCEAYCRREYHVTAKDITIFPEKKIIARKAAFFIGNRRYLYFPVYVMSLKDKRVEHVTFGYDELNGFYFIARYPYIAKEDVTGWAILDHSTKRGDMYGAEHEYDSKRLGGSGKLNFSNRSDELTARSENLFYLAQAFAVGVAKGNLSFDRKSYLPMRGGTTSNTNTTVFNVNRAGKKASHNFYLTKTDQHSGVDMSNMNMKYTQNLKYGRYTSNANFDLTDSGRRGFGRNKLLRTDYTLTRPFKFFNSTFRMIKTFDVDGDSYTLDNNESVQFTQPELTLNFDPSKVTGALPGVLALLPLNKLSYTYGKYTNGQRHNPINRTHLASKKIEAGASKTLNFGKSVTLTPNHNFTQYFYSTTDAMYMFQNTVALNYAITQAHRLSFNYNNVRDSGGVAHAPNRQSEVNNLGISFNAAKPKTSLSASVNRDYRTHRYSTPINLRYVRQTTQHSQFDLTTTYSLDNDEFGVTSTGYNFSRRNMKATITGTWSTEDSELMQSQLTFNFRRNNGWTFDLTGSYDSVSFIKRPLLRQINAVKRNCCTEIQMSYQNDLSEFRFQYIILAFPTKRLGFTSGDKGLEVQQTIFEDIQSGTTQPPLPPGK